MSKNFRSLEKLGVCLSWGILGLTDSLILNDVPPRCYLLQIFQSLIKDIDCSVSITSYVIHTWQISRNFLWAGWREAEQALPLAQLNAWTGAKKRPAKLVEPVCRSASLLPCYLLSWWISRAGSVWHYQLGTNLLEVALPHIRNHRIPGRLLTAVISSAISIGGVAPPMHRNFKKIPLTD